MSRQYSCVSVVVCYIHPIYAMRIIQFVCMYVCMYVCTYVCMYVASLYVCMDVSHKWDHTDDRCHFEEGWLPLELAMELVYLQLAAP